MTLPDRPYQVLATDYDGTLATEGRVPSEAVEALKRFVRSGFRVVLVTGRVVTDLNGVFPALALCTSVVAENGAVLYNPASGDLRPLAPPPPDEFVLALRHANVAPLAVGRVVVATNNDHRERVLETIRELGLELQVVFNKGSVMVLPPGINKGIGLSAAMAELALHPAAAVGVGDAENDHSLLATCGYGVAVENAVQALKDDADLVLDEPASHGVIDLMARLARGEIGRRQASSAATIVTAVPIVRNTEQRE